MKSIVVISVFLLLFSSSFESKTKEKFSRKLFKTMDKEIDKLVHTPVNSSSEEINKIEGESLGNMVHVSSESDSAKEGEGESSTAEEANPDPKSSRKHKKTLKGALGPKKPKKKIRIRNLPYGKELQKTEIDLQDWLEVTSSDYAKMKKYPSAHSTFIHLNHNYTRINDKYINPIQTNGIPGKNYFWFRQNLKYIYYYESPKESNAIGNIYMDNIANVRDILKSKRCFSIFMREDTTYKLCGQTLEIKKKWLCKLQTILGFNLSTICGGHGQRGAAGKFKIKKIIQPMILIPMPAKHCNEKWDYLKAGQDWKCKCSLYDGGVLQSPINLPPHWKAIDTPISPIFDYQKLSNIAVQNSANGMIKEGDIQKIFFKNNALRIFGEFGKIVTLDGAGYYAEEINFHTPSEHLINGERFDMEMKIIHKARTVGDFGKMLTLSFMFKSKPGVYNKFLDKLDFYNLPNPYDTYQEIREDIFIPNIFLDDDIEGSSEMTPFSFFSYQGSVTEPPCNENTIVYVASEPIPVSISTLQLFREALSMPDQVDYLGRIISAQKNLTNFRAAQQQKGRAIFHYDKRHDCPIYKIHTTFKRPGHYERITRKGATYYFVSGDKPSGLPGAFVVTDKEAKGKLFPGDMPEPA